MSDPAPGGERARVAGLRRRIYLTFRYEGVGGALRRVVGLPARFSPLARRLKLGRMIVERRGRARSWYSRQGRPVTVVIPSFESADEVRRAVQSVRRTTSASATRVIVCDDGETPPELDTDVVLMNPDVQAEPGWLECLQYAAHAQGAGVGMVGARLLNPDHTIAHAGLYRNRHAPDRFDPYYGSAPLDFGPAEVPHPVLAVTSACMYVTRELSDRIGMLDAAYTTVWAGVDWCLRAWQEGFQVVYEPGAILEQGEPTSPGWETGEHERASRARFWNVWRPFFDGRSVLDEGGRLRVAYITEGTGRWGGHRVVFEDINRLCERGHDVALYTLGPPPDWFELAAPVLSFGTYEELVAALAPLDAIKVATWWRTAPHVWRASVLHGVPVYLVQDIETSYYPDSQAAQNAVLATYREEFSYLTTSGWNRDRLASLGHEATVVAPGVDLDTFQPPTGARRADMVLAISRSDPLKRFELTVDAWRALGEPRPELCLFGGAPELAPPGSRHVGMPADAQVNALLGECTVFVQTSSHEGFGLPPLEAMATGAAVVCTDADGNRDYCVDGVNCLMPPAEAKALAAAIRSLVSDQALRSRLGSAGIETARARGLERRIVALEEFLMGVAEGARRGRGP